MSNNKGLRGRFPRGSGPDLGRSARSADAKRRSGRALGPPPRRRSGDEDLLRLVPIGIAEASEAPLAVPPLMQASDEDREIRHVPGRDLGRGRQMLEAVGLDGRGRAAPEGLSDSSLLGAGEHGGGYRSRTTPRGPAPGAARLFDRRLGWAARVRVSRLLDGDRGVCEVRPGEVPSVQLGDRGGRPGAGRLPNPPTGTRDTPARAGRCQRTLTPPMGRSRRARRCSARDRRRRSSASDTTRAWRWSRGARAR